MGNTEIMPIWLPAWKTPVNSASSSSRKQTKGCLLAVLPRKMTSLHPCPWLPATLPCTLGTRPLHSAVAVGCERQQLTFGLVMGCALKRPQSTGTRTRSSLHKAVLLVHLPSCKIVIVFYIIPYLFIYYILQFHLSLSTTSASSRRLSLQFPVSSQFKTRNSKLSECIWQWKYACSNHQIL